jgi:non-heme chloroperoxidase
MPVIESKDGTHIHVKSMGTGKPVILIHGWPLTGDMWEYQTVALVEAGFHVITYDRRGFGSSAHPARGYDYDSFADDLAAVIDACTPDGAALVGFSMGGGEIARYLGKYGSAKVAKAALISTVVPYMLKTDDNPDGVPREQLEDFKTQIREDRFAFLQSLAKTLYGVGLVSSPVSQGLLDWTFALAIMASPIATMACVDAFGTTDFRPDLPAFADVPTLVIHGTSDKTVPIDATGRTAAKGIPHAQFIEYDGEPHGLFATAAERLNQDLIGFLRT